MTKKSVRMLSLILAAVLLVVCCFTGCGETLTIEELCEMVKEDFPEAHIDKNEKGYNRLYFFNDEETSEALRYGDLYGKVSSDKIELEFEKLNNRENTEKMLNAVMPIFVKEWSTSDTLDVILKGDPNDDFTEWRGRVHNKYELGFLLGEEDGKLYIWIF